MNTLKVKEVKKLLPNINHFIKRGNLCATECGISCNYCYMCAERIEKFYNKIQVKQEQNAIQPVCISNSIKVAR